MVKRPLLIIILLAIASSAFAQQSWEGLATVSRFGRFPAGLYGASNRVPANSLVSVRNLETGRSERIIITDGVDEPGVFLVLSPEAATLLNISGSGATRVRLTTIVTDSMRVDTASEQPFHPDPDINPAAGAASYPEFPIPLSAAAQEPVVTEPEAVEVAEVVEPDVETTPADEPADEPIVEPVIDPVVEPEMEVSEAVEPVEAPPSTGQRGGIAAGVARTRVGAAQESFERPETSLEADRPGPGDAAPALVGEPEVEPEETATVGIAALVPEEESVPVVAAGPVLPSDGEPAVDETPEAETPAIEPPVTEPETVAVPDTVEAVVVDEGPAPTNPINDAVAAAVNRIPARDFFPAPVGEETDLGFVGLGRPSENGRLDVALAEADVPPVDRPELAGLAPLQAALAVLPASLAEAAVPPEDLPEFAALGIPAPPSAGIDTASLPVARAGEEERPVVEEPARYSAPGAVLTSGSLAEAAVAPLETPSSDGVSRFSAPVEPLDAVLVEAGVAEIERPELADIGPADAPNAQALNATLAEAAVAAEERPDVADIGSADAPSEPELEARLAEAAIAGEELPELADIGPADAPSAHALNATLAEASVAAEERPDLADVGPADAPGTLPLEAVLVEAGVVPPESPNADAVDMVGAPVETVDAELAEAGLAETERPELADVGPADIPLVAEVAALLAEAEPEALERPDDSLAAVEPSPAGEVPTLALEPDPGAEEVSVAEGSMETPADMPTDVLLTLEPADFRPPDVPNPDDESLIDRETPAEEPEFVAVLEIPETTPPEVVEVIEPVEVVEVEEPVEVAVMPVERVAVASAGLPVVSELLDNNYYLQIGAYTVPATAQVAVDALSATYPMAVLPVDRRGTTVYRVLMGPLEQDETGTLLMWLRAKGYRDSFIRSGTEL
jgi:sporulation related protein